MTKIVYNTCYGGFGLSHAAIMRYAEISGVTIYPFFGSSWKGDIVPYDPTIHKIGFMGLHYYLDENKEKYFSTHDISRVDPALVQTVEELGVKANDSCASLAIEELPAGTQYRITEYDGHESVETQDNIGWSVA